MTATAEPQALVRRPADHRRVQHRSSGDPCYIPLYNGYHTIYIYTILNIRYIMIYPPDICEVYPDVLTSVIRPCLRVSKAWAGVVR